MSKLAQHLKAHQTGRRYAEAPKLELACVDVLNDVTFMPFDDVYEYRLEAMIGARFMVDSRANMIGTDDQLTLATKKVRRMVVEEIFGEFRPLIDEIRKAIYEREWKKVDTALDVLHERMFVDGLN